MSAIFDPRALRDAFAAFLTGVTVVTSRDRQDMPFGLTANSFSSVSLEPPLLLVCVGKQTGSYTRLSSASHFAVNILAEDQKDISNTFARPGADRFAGIDWHQSACGSPLLDGAAAWFDCASYQRIDAGDHMIVLGKIKAFGNNGKNGLGYARGTYFTLAKVQHRLLENTATPVRIALVAERDGEILLVPAQEEGWTLPSLSKAEQEGIECIQSRFSVQLGRSVQMGLLYSMYEDTVTRQQHIVYRAALGRGSMRNGGVLFSSQDLPLAQVKDSAVGETLKRYCQERLLGNFGVYFGNQVRGHVYALQGTL